MPTPDTTQTPHDDHAHNHTTHDDASLPGRLDDLLRRYFRETGPTLDADTKATLFATIQKKKHQPAARVSPHRYLILASYATIACIICISVFLPYIAQPDTTYSPLNSSRTAINTLPLPEPAAGTVHASVGRIIETQGRFVIENTNALTIPQTTIYEGDRIQLASGASLRFMLGAGTDARITGPATFKIVRDTADPLTHRSRYRLVLFDGELIHIKQEKNANEQLIIDTPLVAVEPPHDGHSDIALSVPKAAPAQISNNSAKPVRITPHADPQTSISVPTAHTAHTQAPTQETIRTLEQRDETPVPSQPQHIDPTPASPNQPTERTNTSSPTETPQPQQVAQIAVAPSTQRDAIARALRDEAAAQAQEDETNTNTDTPNDQENTPTPPSDLSGTTITGTTTGQTSGTIAQIDLLIATGTQQTPTTSGAIAQLIADEITKQNGDSNSTSGTVISGTVAEILNHIDDQEPQHATTGSTIISHVTSGALTTP